MATIGGITSTEAVRAILGVTLEASEISDQYFLDRGLAAALLIELSKWLPASKAALETAAAAGGEGSQAWLAWEAVKQAAAYWCAWEIAGSGQLAFFQQIGDGQDKVSRPLIDIESLRTLLKEGYDKYQVIVLSLTSTDTSQSSSTPNVSWAFGKSSPAYDPVTGA